MNRSPSPSRARMSGLPSPLQSAAREQRGEDLPAGADLLGDGWRKPPAPLPRYISSVPSEVRARMSGWPSPFQSRGASSAVKRCQPVPICSPLAAQEPAAPVAAVEQQQAVGGAREQVALAVAAPVARRQQRGEAAPAAADRHAAAGDERARAGAAVHQQPAGGVDGEHVRLVVAVPVGARGRGADARRRAPRRRGGLEPAPAPADLEQALGARLERLDRARLVGAVGLLGVARAADDRRRACRRRGRARRRR